MMNHGNLLLCSILICLVGGAFPSVHGAPALTIFPASVATDPNTAASYIVTLNGGTANASYALTVTGLPTGSVYSFSSNTIAPGDSSVLTVQTSIATPLYCPRSYPFTVIATNTLLSSDRASAMASLGVNQVGPGLVVSVSTDKPDYLVGETVTVSVVTNRPAEWTLTVTPPSGLPHKYQFGYTSPPTKTLTATLPAGTWAVTISADDYCGGSSNAVAHFDVVPSTVSSTNTTTVSATTTTMVSSSNTTSVATFAVTSTSTFSSMTSTFTSATSSVTVTSITTMTGAATLVNFLTTTITDQWTVSMLTTLVQGSTTSTVVSIQNLPLELALVSILTISLLIIAVSLIRGLWFGSAITCSKCGFKNSSTASSFCIKCGQPLKRGQST